MQREHAHLVVLAPVARQCAATGEEDEVGRAAPLFDHVESFVDLAPEPDVVQVPREEDRLDGLA